MHPGINMLMYNITLFLGIVKYIYYSLMYSQISYSKYSTPTDCHKGAYVNINQIKPFTVNLFQSKYFSKSIVFTLHANTSSFSYNRLATLSSTSQQVKWIQNIIWCYPALCQVNLHTIRFVLPSIIGNELSNDFPPFSNNYFPIVYKQ